MFPVGAAIDGVRNTNSNYWLSEQPTAYITIVFPSPISLAGIRLYIGNVFIFDQIFNVKVEKRLENGSFQPLNGNGYNITVPGNATAIPSEHLWIEFGTYEVIRVTYTNLTTSSPLPVHELMLFQQ
ncbi:hypothetical protein [Bacillus thuringiensis]|uniref:hypothetical protein n=1 Tax=Bacillus thuringiensis TaxID=1428 RepID=UPI000A35EB01|nr:hypothetical protein [Bacillus thuringiensis]KAB5636344.1 hypothetical protein E8M24_25225 [Bacillus thuringiensis]OUB65007.1 hypothetical protein BK744_30045 [Bacillus thuringiensis serovar zhaodongensis]HDR5271097.1 hypothetical protein [Bacillus thuringiensis]